MNLSVILRTCTRVGALNAHRFGSKRPFTDSKREIVLACLNSLLDSLGKNGVVHVLDDHSPQEDTDVIQKLLKSYGDEHRFVSIEKSGNGHSINAALQYGRTNNFDLMYFCEDDYLHVPHAISSMLDFYQKQKTIIHPVDDFDRYQELYPSFIFLGTYNYWRTVKHTTFTLMISRRILETYWNLYVELAKRNMDSIGSGGEDDTINKIYERETCASPIPSLAAHISPTPPLPPFVNWQTVFDKNKTEALRRISL